MASNTTTDEASERAPSFADTITPLIRSTFRSEVIKGIGTLGGMFSVATDKFQNLVLVPAVNGLGAKVRIASISERYDILGFDLVAICVNDLLSRGAEPLFVVDYYASREFRQPVAMEIVRGLVSGCKAAHCTLLGGETSTTPSACSGDAFVLAGMAVGAVEQDRLLDGSAIAIGHNLIGVVSDSLQGWGFTTALEQILDVHALPLDEPMEALGAQTLREALLEPTRIYVKTILNLLRDFPIAGVAHIGAGGVPGRLSRMLPSKCQAVIQNDGWPRPPLLTWLQKLGNFTDELMFQRFNQGLGMVVISPPLETDDVLDRLESLGEKAFTIGRIERREEGDPAVRFDP